MGVELAPEDLQDQSVQITPADQPQSSSQPTLQPIEKLDEQAVRAAMKQAADAGVDPFSLAVGDLKQGETPQAQQPLEVPEKFKKPNGEVDVEKLNTSTRQLDEAIQQKEQKLVDVNKFVEEQLRAYKEKEKRLSSTPNPDKVTAQLPSPVAPAQMTDEQMEQMINADINKNPARVMAEFVKIQLAKELGPIYEERKDAAIRNNLRELAGKDVRVVEHIDAINAKLNSDPDLWNLKNPHKAAWLEVKEDLRLGESTRTQAQPSKPAAPILGGGTPPPAPSSSPEMATQDAIFAAAQQLGTDPRNRKYDPKQQAALDAVAKKWFDQLDRTARRF